MSESVTYGSQLHGWSDDGGGIVGERPAFWDRAECLGVGPALFFADGQGDMNGAGASTPAKRVCSACVVREECLQYALDTHQKFGIWGGLTERERRRIRPRRGSGRPREEAS